MSPHRKQLGWFLAGAVVAATVASLDLPVVSSAWADEVAQVPSDKTHQPNVDVVYDETWEAAEFLAIPRKKLDPPGLPIDGVMIKVVTSGLGALGAIMGSVPAGAIQVTNSIPVRFFDRESVWRPDGGPWTLGDDRPSTGFAGLMFPTGQGGVAGLGMPVVTKWRVTGHIHSQE